MARAIARVTGIIRNILYYFKKPYDTDPGLKKFVRRLLSVGFPSLQEMGCKMGQFCGMQATTQLHQKYPELQDLLRYFYNTWFVTDPPRFGTSLIARNLSELIIQLKVGTLLGTKKFANKWVSIRFLKGEEVLTNALLGQIEKGETPAARIKKMAREITENIAVLKPPLTSGERNLDDYSISIGSLCANNV